jgi:pilus assembly protein CpaB
MVSQTVLRDLRVLAMDQRSLDAKKEVVVPQTATLEVTPKQAEVLTLATELGKVALSLRSLAAPEGAPAEAPSRTSDHDLTEAPRPARASSPVRRISAPRISSPQGVEVVRGLSTATEGVTP